MIDRSLEFKQSWCGTIKVGSANLSRSYRRAPKGAGNNGDFGVHGPGICHLCMAGSGIDWEDLFL